MRSRQLCKNLSLIWRLQSPISIVLSRLNSKSLTFSFYMMFSEIPNIAVPPLILFFLFNWLWDLLPKFECKYSSWALTIEGLLSVSHRIGCCQNLEDHGYSLCLTATEILNTHYIVYLQTSCIFAVWYVFHKICFILANIHISSFQSTGLETWTSIPNLKTVLLKSYKYLYVSHVCPFTAPRDSLTRA